MFSVIKAVTQLSSTPQSCYLYTWTYSRMAWGISRWSFLNKTETFFWGCQSSSVAPQRLPDLVSGEQPSLVSHPPHPVPDLLENVCRSFYEVTFLSLNIYFLLKIYFSLLKKNVAEVKNGLLFASYTIHLVWFPEYWCHSMLHQGRSNPVLADFLNLAVWTAGSFYL